MLANKTLLLRLTLLASAFCSLHLSAAVLRDPTLPAVGVSVGRTQVENVETGLVLKSIVRSAGKSSAVINKSILSIGDSIQGVRVKDITADTVLLSDGRKLTLFKAITEEVEK